MRRRQVDQPVLSTTLLNLFDAMDQSCKTKIRRQLVARQLMRDAEILASEGALTDAARQVLRSLRWETKASAVEVN